MKKRIVVLFIIFSCSVITSGSFATVSHFSNPQKGNSPTKIESTTSDGLVTQKGLYANQFISKISSVTSQEVEHNNDDDHRLTLRIPKYLLAKIDQERRKRVGKISRNLWILEVIERATKKK